MDGDSLRGSAETARILRWDRYEVVSSTQWSAQSEMCLNIVGENVCQECLSKTDMMKEMGTWS